MTPFEANNWCELQSEAAILGFKKSRSFEANIQCKSFL
jgi:hypothetical protein